MPTSTSFPNVVFRSFTMKEAGRIELAQTVTCAGLRACAALWMVPEVCQMVDGAISALRRNDLAHSFRKHEGSGIEKPPLAQSVYEGMRPVYSVIHISLVFIAASLGGPEDRLAVGTLSFSFRWCDIVCLNIGR
jgi:hypothetical protein